MSTTNKRGQFVALVCILLVLSVGAYYYFYRQGIAIYVWLGVDDHFTNPFLNNILASWPSFTHVFVFSLWSWWAFDQRYARICIIFWLFINLFFEILQGCSGWLINKLPKNIYNYIHYGTFSWYDVLALFVGALIAFVVIGWIQGENRFSEKSNE